MAAFDNELIYKHGLHQFLRTLKREARHIYAVLYGAPTDCVWINKNEGDFGSCEKQLSVKEFLAKYGEFNGHEDQFKLCFKVYYFQSDWGTYMPNWRQMNPPFSGTYIESLDYIEELTVETMAEFLPHILANICRNALLENTPFLLLNGNVKEQYGFVRTDIEKLREIVTRCNLRLVDDLAAEYECLKAIDWVREHADGKQLSVIG